MGLRKRVEAELRRNPTDIPGILPRYDGLGLTNLPSTLLGALGVAPPDTPGLRSDLVPAELTKGLERIVLLLLDGLGHLQLQREIAARNVPNLRRLTSEGLYFPMTTVLPSTTATALTTLCTGLAPQQHGIMGYRLYLREYGFVVNMIHLGPTQARGTLVETGVDPRTLIPGPSIFERCRVSGVQAYLLTRFHLIGTPLSTMLHRGAQPVAHGGSPDLFVHIRRLLKGRSKKRAFIFAYWDAIDAAGHAYGASSEEHSAELASLDFSLGRELLDHGGDGKTLVVVTGDHGHIDVPTERMEFLDNHPDLLRLLLVEPTGDARLPYLHARPGRAREVEAYLQKHLGSQGFPLASTRAFQEGLFGLGPSRPEARDRAGDFLLIPREGWAFPYRQGPGESLLVGRHGGTSEAEMLVPLLLHRL